MTGRIQKLNPLIDGDTFVYRCGFAAKDDEPIEYHIHTLKRAIENVLAVFPERSKSQIYLTGKHNFREHLATILPYKGNRKDDRKPMYYNELREYLVNRMGAVVIDGMEADDAIGMAQWEARDRSTCIVTNDKDLKQIPGWHYNWTKDERPFWVHPDEANAFFYQQMIQGDRTDNIPGIYGYGDKSKKAAALFARLGTDSVLLKDAAETLYRQEYGDNWEEAYGEVASLVFILREPAKIWRHYFV